MKYRARRRTAAVVVFHNHPSGVEPSDEDVALTRRLIAAGVLMSIDVIDHLILGNVCYVSMKGRVTSSVGLRKSTDSRARRAIWCSALLDLGLPLDGLRAALGSLGSSAARVGRTGAQGRRVGDQDSGHRRGAAALVGQPAQTSRGRHEHHHHHGDDHAHDHSHDQATTTVARGPQPREIAAAIERSALAVEEGSRDPFVSAIGRAEAAIHDVPSIVHLHGSVPSTRSSTSSAVHGMEWLGVDRVVGSPLASGAERWCARTAPIRSRPRRRRGCSRACPSIPARWRWSS